MDKMPSETPQAVEWALQQEYELEHGIFVPVSPDIPFTVVDKVREYFNEHGIEYDTFSFKDLEPFLN